MNNYKSNKLKIVYAIYLIFTIIYIVSLPYRPYPLSYIIKIIPIISLGFAAVLSISSSKAKYIIAALIFSATGDVLLSFRGNMYFVPGLVCFGIAHCFYIAAFLQKIELKCPRCYLIIFFLVYGSLIIYLLLPALGKMTAPVLFYIFIIISMGISTVIGEKIHYLVIAGAILFIMSDSIIAINTFLLKINNSSLFIMLTYFPAQFLIIFGTAKSE